MREIKFRGKCVEIGEWLYGDLIRDNDYFYIGRAVKTLDYSGYWKVIVRKNTIGQYTGLKDINGKEIYEGDIVKCKKSSFVVEYSEYGEWCLGIFLLSNMFRVCEVIGDIHENPELLER